jgi:hypothetical protein
VTVLLNQPRPYQPAGLQGQQYFNPQTPRFPQLGNPTSRLPEGTGWNTGYGQPGLPEVAPPSTFQGQTVAPTATTFTDPSQAGAGVDWSGLIGSSWEVNAAQAMMASQMARARANLQATLRQNFIDLGVGDTSQLGSSLGKYIDKNTIQQAINNKYSVYGQTAQQEARANAQNAYGLAARGMLSSGQYTKSTQDVTNAAEQSRYMGLREFLRAGQQGLTGLGDTEASLASGVMQAQFAAAQRVAQQQAAAAALAAAQGAGVYGGRTDTQPQAPQYVDPGWIVNGGGGSPYYVSPASGLGNFAGLENYGIHFHT